MSSEIEDLELYKIRHSMAHVLAQAVLKLRPGTKLGFGPPIADGFYYDFILSEPLSDEDFPEIERTMKKLMKNRQFFNREELPVSDAFARIEEMGEPYKREYAEELVEKKGLDSLTFYRNGDFLDMCDGPHVEHTRELPRTAFKLRSLAGAYWRGDSDNVQMTRIYAWAFKTKEELDAHIEAYEEALRRDHKKLGKELEYFFIDDEIGKGLPLWLPNGTILRDELEKLARELEFRDAYQRVTTPVLAKASLYYKTGHLPYYKEHMYPFMELDDSENEDGEKDPSTAYCLRPMNCPHHHKVFGSRSRSYRELPVRLAEYGNVYRYEDSGALSGLLRVRGMCMNDAHIYCTEDQIKSEFRKVLDLHRRVYEVLGLTDYHLRLSTWDPEDPKGKEKYVDDPPAWEFSQNVLREVLVESGLPYKEVSGEAAFYGPKIDIQFRTVTGREETASTVQLDFAVPERMGLKYVGADNQEHTPWCIHRAPLGTHERFVAFLIEHYGGAFPSWLAPVQVRVLTVSDRFNEHAQGIVDDLRNMMVRAELDTSGDRIAKKIRRSITEKVPNVIVIGESEVENNTVTVQHYGSRAKETMDFDTFARRLQVAIQTRSKTFPQD